MPTDADAERAWQGLRQRGEHDTLLFPVRKHLAALRLKLDTILVKRLLTPKQWGELQYLQGQIKGLADIIYAIDGLSKPAVEKQPRHRSDGP
jgi:hypothetical protein